jgi:hypothetical protein
MPDSYAGSIAVSSFQFQPSARHAEPPRTKACRERYNRLTTANDQVTKPDDSTVPWKTAACHYLDVIVDVINKAGPNPTRAAVGAAAQTLPAREYFGVLSGSFAPGKTDYQDGLRLMQWDRENGTSNGCNASKSHCWNEHGDAFDPAT